MKDNRLTRAELAAEQGRKRPACVCSRAELARLPCTCGRDDDDDESEGPSLPVPLVVVVEDGRLHVRRATVGELMLCAPHAG